MAKFRVEYNRDKCISASSCAAIDPAHFVMNADGKADLKGGKKEGKLFVIEVDDVSKLEPAAQSCPANIIHIIDLKTKKKLI